MAKQLPKAKNPEDMPYFAFGSDANSKSTALAHYGETVQSFDVLCKSTGSYFNFGEDAVNGINVRPSFDRHNYLDFRPNEALPTKFCEIVKTIRGAYKSVGIVRNVVDLMADFVAEGVILQHKDADQQAFYKIWANKVDLQSRAIEFAKRLLLEDNVVVKRSTAVLNIPVENQLFKGLLSKGAPDFKISVDKKKIFSREIPFRYKFLDITKLQWSGGSAALLTDARKLMMNLPRDIVSLIQHPRTAQEKELIKKLPEDFIKEVRAKGRDTIELNMDKVYVAHNKKDDWECWAIPFLYAVLSDITFKKKLRQAELSALDGVINVIRLWKLGDHKEGILPSPAAAAKLKSLLSANTGGGALDLVWDSMIEMQDFYPPVDKILGSEKYDQVNKDILIGLGIPEILLGGRGSNFSNSFIQLKTVIERLETVRVHIEKWINHETQMIVQALGFDEIPKVKFEDMNLRDENVEKKLILGLLDRGVISVEGVLETYGKDFEIEMSRIKDQAKVLKDSDVEVKSPLDNKGGEGSRSLMTKDTTKRKTREAKPRTTASFSDGMRLIDNFDSYIVPTYLEANHISNARKLTSSQKEELNRIRVYFISCINSLEDVDKAKAIDILQNGKSNKTIIKSIEDAMSSFMVSKGKKPTLSEMKTIEASVWAENFTEVSDED